MKRLYIGISVLVLLLAIGLFAASATSRMYTPIVRLLEEASASALQNELSAAYRQATEAHAAWDRCKKATATVGDHTPMEEIDHLFAEAEIYAKAGEAPHFAACCARLGAMVRDMADAHRPDLWNLL